MVRLLPLVFVLSACAHGQVSAPRAPDWPGPGSGAYAVGNDLRLVGLGAAAPESEPGLAAERASARARLELATLIDELVDGAVDRVAGMAALSGELRALAQHEVELGLPWTGPDGNVYVAGTLELRKLQDALGASGSITGELAARVRQALPEAFASLQRQGVRPVSLPEPSTAAPTVEPDTGLCFVRLEPAPPRLGTVSCILEDRVAHAQGLLRYPCGGGDAEAVFGDARFAGHVLEGEADLKLTGTFRYRDGCTWSHEQRLQGRLDDDVLHYTYRETAAPGQDACEDSCEAAREVRITR